MGLAETVVGKFLSKYGSSRALYLAVRRHLRGVAATHPSSRKLTQGYPFNVRYSCQFAREGDIVGTVYQHFKPKEIVVEAVREGRVVRTHTLRPAFERRSENRVIWGHLAGGAGGVYVCATASGRWEAYCLASRSSVLQWRGNPLYDPELRLACCDSCLLVAMAKLVSFHAANETAYWDIQVVHLGAGVGGGGVVGRGPARVLRFKLKTDNRDITGRRAGYGRKKAWLLSQAAHTGATPTERPCREHLLLLQWGNSVAGHTLSLSEGLSALSRSPQFRYTLLCPELDTTLVRAQGLNTPFHLSADGQLLALVFGAQLHVWEVWSGREVSSAILPLRMHSFEELRLVAVGHLYSVVGLEFSGSLMVVFTHTGRAVLHCEGFAQRHNLMMPPYIQFLCVSSEGWLSDVCTPCQGAVLYWNKTNQCMEGVRLGEGGSGENSEPPLLTKKAWWKIW